MVWRETCAVDERMGLALAVEAGEEPIAALCRRFGISRRVGYKWLSRYREAGVAGLADRFLEGNRGLDRAQVGRGPLREAPVEDEPIAAAAERRDVDAHAVALREG